MMPALFSVPTTVSNGVQKAKSYVETKLTLLHCIANMVTDRVRVSDSGRHHVELIW
jgi:hypothetical protein